MCVPHNEKVPSAEREATTATKRDGDNQFFTDPVTPDGVDRWMGDVWEGDVGEINRYGEEEAALTG